jgi:hypothetical protein
MSEQSRIGLITQLRRHAVAYPETTERDSRGRRTFEVRGNAFLSVAETGGSCEVTLKLDASLDTARAYGAAEPDHYAVGEDGWVTVRFSADKSAGSGRSMPSTTPAAKSANRAAGSVSHWKFTAAGAVSPQ